MSSKQKADRFAAIVSHVGVRVEHFRTHSRVYVGSVGYVSFHRDGCSRVEMPAAWSDSDVGAAIKAARQAVAS